MLTFQIRVANGSPYIKSCTIRREDLRSAVSTIKWVFENLTESKRGCVGSVMDRLIGWHDATVLQHTFYEDKADLHLDLSLSRFSWEIKLYEKNGKWFNEPVVANLDLVGTVEIYVESYRVSWSDIVAKERGKSVEMSLEEAEDLRRRLMAHANISRVRVSKTRRSNRKKLDKCAPCVV